MSNPHDSDPLDVSRSVVDGMYDAAALLDPELRMIAGNAAYARLAGLRPRTLEAKIKDGVSPFLLLKTVDGADHRASAACVGQNRPQHLAEQRITNADGAEFVTWMSFLPLLDGKSRLIGVIQQVRDVTGETATHLRLRELLGITQARADTLERAVEQRTKELRAALDEVTRLSRTDALTGLLNRRAFVDAARQVLSVANRHRRNAAVLMCDLDHFKKLNDTLGHQAGDAMLVAVARAMRSNLRESDLLCRFGGEEFVVLVTETAPNIVEDVAKRLNRIVRSLVGVIPGSEWKQTISVGAAIYPIHGESLDQLIEMADRALYLAKDQGRDRAVLYQSTVETSTLDIRAPKPRVLAVVDPKRVGSIEASLLQSFDLVVTSSVERSMELAAQNAFEVIISTETIGERSGLDLLGGTLSSAPSSLRFLLVPGVDAFHAHRASNLAKVDAYLLEDEIDTALRSAVRDALARRELDREVLGTSLTRRSYASLDDIQELLQDGSVKFIFQPILDDAKEIFACEFFCRLPDDVGLTPSKLFEEAARTGDIWPVGRLTREGLAQEIANVPEGRLVFVSLHPAELRDPELVCGRDELANACDRVVFEISEHATERRFDRAKSDIDALRRLGFRIAIDDPGSGHGRLSALRLLQPSYLKLGRIFTRRLHASKARFDFVARTVQAATDLGIRVIASELTSEEEASACAAAGCTLFEGPTYGTPTELP